ncbi:MAG: SIMPL domain-containing protein [Gammaproteobacteria bacterium]|nr:SIMPL domain-containing protein [Gammaproteobacteria bacterium]
MSRRETFEGRGALGAAALALLASALTPAAAHDPAVTFDRVSFSVSASREVANDTLVGVMYAQREGEDAATLADAVNQAVTGALARAREVPAVQASTLDYRQSPVYRNQRVSGWRVYQSIRLESRDADALGALIGELQSELALQSVHYSVSGEARAAVEDELIAEAMAAYQRRAALVAAELGRASFRLVAMDVSTPHQGPTPLAMRATAMASEAGGVAAPSLEAGVQDVTVQVNATIELEVN